MALFSSAPSVLGLKNSGVQAGFPISRLNNVTASFLPTDCPAFASHPLRVPDQASSPASGIGLPLV
jgi:hypothetical protein